MREAGANAFQELGFTLANAVAVLDELVRRGVDLDRCYRPVAGLVAGLDLFEEVSKHRAYRRMFARVMRERYNLKNPSSMSVLMYDNSQASSFTAQQPLNNIIRGAITGLVQALAGIQVMTIASYDEAHAIPSADAAKIALRTQQIIASETGIINTVDPLAGSYFVETLTDQIEGKAFEVFDQIEERGGAIACIEQGFQEKEIAEEAYKLLKKVKSGEKVVVGVNQFREEDKTAIDIMRVDPKEEDIQIRRVKKLKNERDNRKVKECLDQLRDAAIEQVNLVSPICDAIKAYSTIGEICDTLREVYGEYKFLGL